MQTEYRNITDGIKPHTVVQVIAHVRNMEEMGKVLFAPMNGLQDELATAGRQTGIDVVHSLGIQIVHDLI